MDYVNLDKASDSRHATPFVFRVYTANSLSPFVPSPPQHTEDDMSGFFAPSASMRLSKTQYLEQYGHLRRGGWARGKGLGASMVAHILNRPHGQLGRTNAQTSWEDVTPGDLSPWISATRSLDHAIWDISNRLARGETVVKMAVIRQSKGADAGGWEWSERGKTRSIRGSEVWTMATGEIAVERNEAPYGEKPHWDRAHRRVLACEEILYYGRIFGDSVAADLTFTRETLPFALPSHLLRSAIHPQHHDTRRGWLGVIRWDAPYTDWAQAKRRISSQITGRPSVCPQIYILAPEPEQASAYQVARSSPHQSGSTARHTPPQPSAPLTDELGDLAGLIWPTELPRREIERHGPKIFKLPEGVASDILDLAWSTYELRPDRLVDI